MKKKLLSLGKLEVGKLNAGEIKIGSLGPLYDKLKEDWNDHKARAN
ncbi:MAG: hypothetical protein NTY03_01290 [Candidatus Bathyarchaeota archaeon]|nr:hypothetical protein [Candidatus Bathyarchaeota archaeon]